MAIIRNQNKENYTVVDNKILKNKNLSLKARGMLLTLLSLPDDWDFSENGLEALFCDGLTAIKTALKELEKNGYLQRKQIRDNKGKFLQNEWIIYEKPTMEQPILENPITEKPILENDTQSNTNKSNTKELNIYSPSKDEQDNPPLKETELADNFDKIWKLYPRKDGKNTAYRHYKAWLEGKMYAGRKVKLDNKQMWYATKKYADLVEREKIDKQYIKMGSTFFNEAIMEFVEEEK